MSKAAQTKQRWKLLFLGVPLLVLVFASIALTAFLSVDLILQGVRDRQPGPALLGALLAALWIGMFYRTARARLKAGV
jgi:hypothetical protein